MSSDERRAYNKVYREKHREKQSAYHREWYAKNRERILRECDSEKRRLASKKWYANNRDKVREWYAKNREAIREKYKANREAIREKYIKKLRIDERFRWKALENNAKRRGIDIEPEFREAFGGMFGEACHYCGITEAFGVDRRINDVHYAGENCVSCCGACNMMKGEHDDREFINLCRHLVHRHGRGLGGEPHPKLFRSARGKQSVSTAKYNAGVRGIAFRLTDDDYERIKGRDCHYCGKIRANGADRVDSHGCYERDNVVPACKTCNYLKRQMLPDEFLDHVARIVDHRIKTESPP